MKNLWLKRRDAENPYYEVDDGKGFNYKVLKVNKDPNKPYATCFCIVVSPMTGPSGDMGDTYCEQVPGLTEAWNKAHE